MNTAEIERISDIFNEEGYYEASYDDSEDLGIIEDVTAAFQTYIVLPASLSDAYDSLFLSYSAFEYMEEAIAVMPSVQVRVTQIEQLWNGAISFTFFFVFEDNMVLDPIRVGGILMPAFALVVTVMGDEWVDISSSKKRSKKKRSKSKSNTEANKRRKSKAA